MELDEYQAMILLGGKKEHDRQEGKPQRRGKILTIYGIKFTIMLSCSKVLVMEVMWEKLLPDYSRLDLGNLLS